MITNQSSVLCRDSANQGIGSAPGARCGNPVGGQVNRIFHVVQMEKGHAMVKNLTFDKLVGTTWGKYRLEQLVRQNNSELIFLARLGDATTTYLLRIFPRPVGLTPREREDYQERFLRLASQIAALQHPHILPVLDYGIEQGMAYLVSQHIPMRPLRARLAKSGALDMYTAGRYLDQIAATLEYAHRQNILHENLSIDTIFIRLDGQLVVADFGVTDLLELNGLSKGAALLSEKSGVCAPEQLLGKPLNTATDVYALGVVLYHLLAGVPVFAGSTPEELAQQHLYAQISPLSKWRGDLPPGLYSVIARALAKDPAQRFSQPGVFANAYARIVDPNNRARVPFVSSSPSLYHTEEAAALAAAQPEIGITELDQGAGRTTDDKGNQILPIAEPQTPTPRTLPSFEPVNVGNELASPRPSLSRRLRRKSMRRVMPIIFLVALLVVASLAISITMLIRQGQATVQMTGQVLFMDTQNGLPGNSDALTITASNLNAPAPGYQYAAWLIDSSTEEILPLGVLSEKNATFTLRYTDRSGSGQAVPNLLALGTRIEVTLEKTGSRAPQGNAILNGSFPPQPFVHIQHLLVQFPTTPEHKGVLVGTLEQTRLLNMQAAVLQYLAASSNSAAVECVAQSMIDLIEGTQGANYHPLASACAAHNITAVGDGFGLLGDGYAGKGYLALSEGHASLAINLPDATSSMHQHAGLLLIALSNITAWLNTIDRDAFHLLNNPTDSASIQEIVALSDAAYHGIDTNGDGLVDPVAGEAGAITAYEQGQLMAALPLTAA